MTETGVPCSLLPRLRRGAPLPRLSILRTTGIARTGLSLSPSVALASQILEFRRSRRARDRRQPNRTTRTRTGGQVRPAPASQLASEPTYGHPPRPRRCLAIHVYRFPRSGADAERDAAGRTWVPVYLGLAAARAWRRRQRPEGLTLGGFCHPHVRRCWDRDRKVRQRRVLSCSVRRRTGRTSSVLSL